LEFLGLELRWIVLSSMRGSRKNVGDYVKFDFCVKDLDDNIIHTVSEISWIEAHDDKVLLGLRFRKMKPDHQRLIESLVKSRDVLSIIPDTVTP
jgi:hypothetical protein